VPPAANFGPQLRQHAGLQSNDPLRSTWAPACERYVWQTAILRSTDSTVIPTGRRWFILITRAIRGTARGSCHNPKNGARQTNAWLTKPSRAACGSCHDDVKFRDRPDRLCGDPTLTHCRRSTTRNARLPYSAGRTAVDASSSARTPQWMRRGNHRPEFYAHECGQRCAGQGSDSDFYDRDNAGNGFLSAVSRAEGRFH